MTKQHTPGPWAWIKDNESWFLLQNTGAQKIILKASDLKTCPAIPENWQEGPLGLRLVDFDSDSPNAKLISAAPFLFEALIRLVPIAEKMMGKIPFVVDALLEAENAIAKVKGDS